MKKMRVKANGTELEVNSYQGTGETIIFLHFSGGNLAQWNGIIPYFIDRYNIITMDLRGHGKSEKAENGYDLNNFAKDVIAVMDELGVNRAHIVGSSLGGEIAVVLGANYGERILSIVAEGAIQSFFGENGVINIPEESIPNKKMELREKRANKPSPVYDSIAEKIEVDRRNYEEMGLIWNHYIEEFLLYDSLKTEENKYISSCPKWVIDKYLEDYWDTKFEVYFKKISCPVLLLPSEEEWETEEIRTGIDGFRRLLKFSKVEVIPRGLHAFVAFQYPGKFSGVIQEFYMGL